MAGIAGFAAQQVQGTVAGQISRPEWKDGICSCMDETDMCLQTWCCFPCTVSNILNKREMNQADCDCVTCLCFLIGTYATNNRYPTWLAMAFRREVIQEHVIQTESQCNSCMLGLCCMPCTMCQVQREMADRGQHAGGCCAKPPQESMGDKLAGAVGGAVAGVIASGQVSVDKMDFETGLCDCNCMECLEGWCCMCCVFGYIGNTLDKKMVSGHPGQDGAIDPISCCGALWYPQGWGFFTRREVIQRARIRGESHLMSLIKVLCCPFCSALQARRELGHRGEWPGGLLVSEMPQK